MVVYINDVAGVCHGFYLVCLIWYLLLSSAGSRAVSSAKVGCVATAVCFKDVYCFVIVIVVDD